MKKQSIVLDKISKIAQKMGSQDHFRSLRDAFVTTVPFLVLAGVMILINNVIIAPDGFLSNIISVDLLTSWQELGNRIVAGTMSIYSLLIGVLVAYSLAQNKRSENPIIPAVVALSVIFILMPLTNSMIPVGAEKAVEIGGTIPFTLVGTGGVFIAILSAMLSTELFMRISKNNKLKIRLGGNVPPAVTQSFNALFAIMITLLTFGLVAYLIHVFTSKEISELITQLIQAPLVHLTTSLPGFLILCGLTNLLFTLGIHAGGIINPILEPPLLVAMQENMDAFANNQLPPNIITLPFRDLYGHIGGTGTTIALLIAIFMFSKRKENRSFVKITIPTSLFNINEPIVFGFPIIFNPLLMIPFIFGPLVMFVIAYFATWANLVSRIVVYVPWSTPPFINAYLASGGDWRNVVLQIILVVVGVVIYLPFLKAYEKSMPTEEIDYLTEVDYVKE